MFSVIVLNNSQYQNKATQRNKTKRCLPDNYLPKKVQKPKTTTIN